MRGIPVCRSGRGLGRAVVGFWILLAFVFFGAPFQVQEPSEVEQALECLSDVLQRDQSLDPATRRALFDLVEAPNSKRADTPRVPEGPAEITPDDDAPTGYVRA